MKAPSVPQPINPYVSSGAQTQSNIETALANARLGAVNQVTPYGTVSYSFGTPPPKAASGGPAGAGVTPYGVGGGGAAGGAAAGGAAQPTYAQRVYQRLMSQGGVQGPGGYGGKL